MSQVNEPVVRGFAWFAYPDQSTPGALGGDNPFSRVTSIAVDPPPGVAIFWSVGDTSTGIRNYSIGRAYLVLTEEAKPPEVGRGWEVEPAHLDENCQIDQRGTRWVRLARVIGTRETRWGPVQECEFEVIGAT